MKSARTYDDWTGNVIPDVTVRSLDIEAMRVARVMYEARHPQKAEECRTWDDSQFLTRLGVFKRGRMTNAAMILLGKRNERLIPESICIKWRLLSTNGREEDSRTFDGPAILSVRQVASRIRNVSVETGGVRPRTVGTYRTMSLMEAMYNALAHQDYSMGGTIEVVERERESVTVRNMGGFGNTGPETHVLSRPTGCIHRNPFLSDAMVSLGIVSGTGSGVRNMYLSQIYRRFPLPRYVLTDDSVSLTFSGVRSGPLVRMLDSRGDLDLETVMELDRLASGRYVPDKILDGLIRRGLVDVVGGVPSIISQSPLAFHSSGTDREAVLSLFEGNGRATRGDVVSVLMARDSKGLTPQQLSNRATNILQTLRKEGVIRKIEGNTRSAVYSLIEHDTPPV